AADRAHDRDPKRGLRRSDGRDREAPGPPRRRARPRAARRRACQGRAPGDAARAPRGRGDLPARGGARRARGAGDADRAPRGQPLRPGRRGGGAAPVKDRRTARSAQRLTTIPAVRRKSLFFRVGSAGTLSKKWLAEILRAMPSITAAAVHTVVLTRTLSVSMKSWMPSTSRPTSDPLRKAWT